MLFFFIYVMIRKGIGVSSDLEKVWFFGRVIFEIVSVIRILFDYEKEYRSEIYFF